MVIFFKWSLKCSSVFGWNRCAMSPCLCKVCQIAVHVIPVWFIGCKVSNLIYILSFWFTDFRCRECFEKYSWSCIVWRLQGVASTGYVTSVASIMNWNVWKWQFILCSERCQYNSLYFKLKRTDSYFHCSFKHDLNCTWQELFQMRYFAKF